MTQGSLRRAAWPAGGLRGAEKVARHRVTFVNAEREVTVEVGETEYLLEAANAVGLDLPYMCLQG